MAMYSYKYVRDQVPPFVTEDIPDYKGDCAYDGDQWTAASDYIYILEQEIKNQFNKTNIIFNIQLYDWLKNRKHTPYIDGPVI